jgi:hypothetical protein
MTNYRRFRLKGGCYFFGVALAHRLETDSESILYRSDGAKMKRLDKVVDNDPTKILAKQAVERHRP